MHETLPIEGDPTPFMTSLRQALEHVCDSEWLRSHSTLQSLSLNFQDGAHPGDTIAMTRIVTTGLPAIDARLQRIWRDWTEREKTPLQRALWEALCRMQNSDGRDIPPQTLLMLTYFDEPRPKQAEVIKLLAIGRTTYFRHLEGAVVQIREAFVETLRPALRLEVPAGPKLIGRAAELQAARQALDEGRVACIVGASGLGKTALAAALARAWPHGAFWHTFRIGLGDHLEQVLFALSYFFHLRGASNAWLYLTTGNQPVNAAKGLALIRQALDELRHAPPLLCFDEVDLLLGDELNDRENHAVLRGLLEDLARGERFSAPMLLVGQRLVIEPDSGCVYAVERFHERELAALLDEQGYVLDHAALQRLLAHTRGNPLLLRLFLTLNRATDAGKRGLEDALSALSEPPTLDWFLVRLWPHLNEREREIVRALAVFDGPVPASAFVNSRRALAALVKLELIVASDGEFEHGTVLLHPALRKAVYRNLSGAQARELHAFAATVCAERGEITAAARHFLDADQPSRAVWVWSAHADQEIAQGQSGAALAIFERARQMEINQADDKRALALILARLYRLTGKTAAGLDALNGASWPAPTRAGAESQFLRGQLLAMDGQIDRALDAYRASLSGEGGLAPAKAVSARAELARQMRMRAQNLQSAQREALRAQHDVEMLLGELADERGDSPMARAHYDRAQAIAADIDDPVLRAKAHEALGILHAHHVELEAAIAELTRAGQCYEAYGNAVCAIGVTRTNLSYAFLAAGRYRDAIAPAEEALRFFEPLDMPYWLSLNQTNLAEAHALLGELDTAEQYAQLALRHEEGAVLPYCMYVQSHIQRQRGDLAEAERLALEAIELAEAAQDPWALGPAQRALAFVYRDSNRVEAFADALKATLVCYTRLGVRHEIDALRGMLDRISTTGDASVRGSG